MISRIQISKIERYLGVSCLITILELLFWLMSDISRDVSLSVGSQLIWMVSIYVFDLWCHLSVPCITRISSQTIEHYMCVKVQIRTKEQHGTLLVLLWEKCGVSLFTELCICNSISTLILCDNQCGCILLLLSEMSQFSDYWVICCVYPILLFLAG